MLSLKQIMIWLRGNAWSCMHAFDSDDMDPESDKIYELLRGSTAPTVPAAGGTSSASNGSAPVIEDDDDVCVLM